MKPSCVLITGASSGIGKALALEFARRRYAVALVARNESALREIAALCEREAGVATSVLACDLASPNAPAEVQRWLEKGGITVDVLVNNAGFTEHGQFIKTDLEREKSMVELQIQTPLALVKTLLPGMIARRKGGVLTIASVYSFFPAPEQAVYAACKAFLLSFSEALAVELQGTGVQMTTVCPGVTQTEFRQRAGVKEKCPGAGMTAAQVARASVDAFEKGERISVPGLKNKFYVQGSRIIPMSWVSSAVKRINKMRGLSSQR